MNRNHLTFSLQFSVLPILLCLFVTVQAHADPYQDCILEAIEQLSDERTVGEIRALCEPKIPTPIRSEPIGLIEKRLKLEREASSNRFAMTQHKSSYMLPLSYNSRVNNTPFTDAGQESDLSDYEVKFQLSVKAQVFDSIMRQRGRIFVAYTNQSYWQLYDQENSAPFRETNHEPEIFADFDYDKNLGGWHIPLVRGGWVHQSNGRSDPLSRSWNRIYAQIFLEKEKWALSFKPWIRVNGDSADVDNPDIDEFMGNFELGIFRQGNSSSASLLLRNNLRSENRGALELNWSKELPYSSKVRFLFQYFYGYGESLIDYNVLTNRVSVGLQLSDFL
ncbi:MAG: phospholipase A [Acidiferrobacterales bacterium]|nr:phospholipase A [Acidiferrobacterales bacterium]